MSVQLQQDFSRLISLAVTLGEGIEKDLINFLTNQEQCRRKWERAEIDGIQFEEEYNNMIEQQKAVKLQLDMAREQLDHALRKRSVYEKRIKHLEQQLVAIASMVNESEGSKTERIKNHSAILRIANSKSHFFDENINPDNGHISENLSDFNDSEEVNMKIKYAKTTTKVKNSKRKIKSYHLTSKNSSLESLEPYIYRHPNFNHSYHYDHRAIPVFKNTKEKKFQSISSDPISSVQELSNNFPIDEIPVIHDIYSDIQSSSSEKKIQKSIETITVKPHNLTQKKEIKPGKCSICFKRIGFHKTFLRCQDCKIKCHEDCKNLISQTCIINSDKIILNKGFDNSLPIKVPTFIVQIICEIEKRGLFEQGLYRKSGCFKDVNDLQKKIKCSKKIDFTKISDIHVLTQMLKLYIRELSEPLITRELHAYFMECGEKNNLSNVYKLIESLPIHNRHTLAFLFLHLRKVARVQENLMDFKALSRVLGPTIIGHSCLNPTTSKMYEDIKIQPVLMELFLGISDEYWNVLLGFNQNRMQLKNILPNEYENKDVHELSSIRTSRVGKIDQKNTKKINLDQKYPVSRVQIEKRNRLRVFERALN